MMWIALVYIGLLFLFLLAKESWPLNACWRPFVERRRSVCKAWREQRLFFSGVFFSLTWFALPIGLIFDWLKDPIEGKFQKPGTQNFIDVWHFLFLGASLAVLYLHPTPLLAMVPLLKLADLFQTLLGYMIQNREAPKSPRPILHLLLIHYPQVIVTFAVLFVVLSANCGGGLFVGKNICGQLDPGDALYFSLATGSTLGFGDITPNLPSQVRGRTDRHWYCLQPDYYVGLEIAGILILTLLFVPYFISGISGGGSKA